MSEENWIEWPSGAELHNLPVGSLVGYPKAAYERTERGLRCYWSGMTANMVGRDFTLDGGWTVPERVVLPRGYHFSGSEVVKDCCERYAMAEAGGVAHVCVGVDPATAPSRSVKEVFDATIAQVQAEMVAAAYQQQFQQIYAQQGGLGLSDYVFRQGDYQQQVSVQLATCPQCTRRGWDRNFDWCRICNVTGKEVFAERSKPTCSCGAISNLRMVTLDAGWGTKHVCGACYQQQRRVELQSKKLEQTKRDMDRPVKRDPYEWLGFSSASWEE